jgi:hypothetical protein
MRFVVEDGKPRSIFFNGNRVFAPQEADDVESIVVAPLMWPDGTPVFDYGREEFALVTRRGHVRIEAASEPFFQPPSTEAYFAPFRVEDALPGELSDNWMNNRLIFQGNRIAAVTENETIGEADARQRVTDIIGDFDKGLITKPDAVRIRDRAARAVKDIDAYRGFQRNGESREG